MEEEERKEHILRAFDQAAKALGNTRNVCRKYYVHPLLVTMYEDGTIQEYFSYAQKKTGKEENLSPSESAMLRIMQSYTPKFKTVEIE